MLKEFEFGSEAISYIRWILSQGKTLSKLLLDLPLEDGRVRTYLPETVSEEATRQFKHGGVIKRSDVRVQRGKLIFELVERKESDLQLATVIADYLHGGASRHAIFEDALHNPGDPGLAKTEGRFFTHGTDVYFFLTAQDQDVDFITTTFRAAKSYLFTGVLTEGAASGLIQANRPVQVETLEELARNANHILIGAYDGEAELIWSRQ